jgi:DNA adenine methylase
LALFKKGDFMYSFDQKSWQSSVKPFRLMAFSWMGSKFLHLKWLLPLLPECGHYIEPFCGSCSVIINRKPANIETINDINGDIVNFFKVLRDEPDELIRLLRFTPWSRQEFVNCIKNKDESLYNVEKARLFYVKTRQSYMAKPLNRSKGNWSHTIDSIGGQSYAVSNNHTIKRLHFIAERLHRVEIENYEATKIIKMYDHKETLFYLDPPYVMGTRTQGLAYVNEPDDSWHIELCNLINDCVAKVALSAYDGTTVLDKLLPSPKWFKTKEWTKPITGGARRTEVLYTNYDPLTANNKPRLF